MSYAYLYFRSRFVNKVDLLELYVTDYLLKRHTVFWTRFNLRLLQPKRPQL